MFFYAHFLESHFHKWLLNSVQSFFLHLCRWLYGFYSSGYWCGASHWFSIFIEKILHPWDKSHLIILYDPFNVLLDLVWLYFLKNFESMFIRYWPTIFFFCDIFVWFWYQGDADFIEIVQKFSFLCNFLQYFEKTDVNFSPYVW